MTTEEKTDTNFQNGAVILPPEWLKPMGEDELREVCTTLLFEAIVQFGDFGAGSKKGIDAVGSLLWHHGRKFEYVDEILVFLGLPLPKRHLN